MPARPARPAPPSRGSSHALAAAQEPPAELLAQCTALRHEVAGLQAELQGGRAGGWAAARMRGCAGAGKGCRPPCARGCCARLAQAQGWHWPAQSAAPLRAALCHLMPQACCTATVACHPAAPSRAPHASARACPARPACSAHCARGCRSGAARGAPAAGSVPSLRTRRAAGGGAGGRRTSYSHPPARLPVFITVHMCLGDAASWGALRGARARGGFGALVSLP